MPTILIVEDGPIDRKLLATVLRSQGHEILQACDGVQALDLVRQQRPDLIISDILMPTLDGYSFVRQLRDDPVHADIPVIFYTASYHQREARALANQCGVTTILTKPSAAAVIRGAVDAALRAGAPAPGAPTNPVTFDREHLRMVGASIESGIDRFETQNLRMAAVAEFSQHIAAERDPLTVLDKACAEAREVTLAQHAIVGILDDAGSACETVITSGLDGATARALAPRAIDRAIVGQLLEKRTAIRVKNPGGRPETLGLPHGEPPVSSLLSVPIASPTRVYGWISLRNKLGSDEFTEDDERAVEMLAGHAAIAYENGRVLHDMHRRLSVVEKKLHGRSADMRRVKDEERTRLSRMLHDELGQALIGLKMDLHWLSTQIGTTAPRKSAGLEEKVETMLQHLDATIRSVRTIAAQLRPGVIGKLGLLEALEWQAEAFERRWSLRCRVDARVAQVTMNRQRLLLVFRIVEEALTNVGRHANASRVWITVRQQGASLEIGVADNGCGIPRRKLSDDASIGLMGMRERAALLGGTVEIGKRNATGTIVTLTIPQSDGPRRAARRTSDAASGLRKRR
jgi:signal transduction histidine kinase/CheY-like chemotaxis protein